jgi:DNA-binding LytR/AlgR family response regulator
MQRKLPSLKIIGECEMQFALTSIIQNNVVDLLFLDINMPKLTGIEFLKTLKNPPLVVFTTAYSEYALDGFELMLSII